MNQNTVTGDYININLRQLGATSIKEFNSIMHIAEFDLGDGLIVSYVFNITRHNKYFLQRMQPYAMVHGKFASDQEIKRKVLKLWLFFAFSKRFKSAVIKSIISHLGHHITENIEQLFLNYNVDADKLESIEDSLEESLVEIQSLFEKSDKLDLPED